MRLTRYRAAQNPPSRGVPAAGKLAGTNLLARMKAPQNPALMAAVRVLSREANSMSRSIAERCGSLHRVATCRARSSRTRGLQPMSRGHFIVCASGHSRQTGLTPSV